MTYLLIDDDTAEGRKLVEELRKSKVVSFLKHPNEETRQALRDAKAKKGVKPMGDIAEWFKETLG